MESSRDSARHLLGIWSSCPPCLEGCQSRQAPFSWKAVKHTEIRNWSEVLVTPCLKEQVPDPGGCEAQKGRLAGRQPTQTELTLELTLTQNSDKRQPGSSWGNSCDAIDYSSTQEISRCFGEEFRSACLSFKKASLHRRTLLDALIMSSYRYLVGIGRNVLFSPHNSKAYQREKSTAERKGKWRESRKRQLLDKGHGRKYL